MTTMVGTLIGKGLLAGALGDLYLFIRSSVYKEQLEQILRELDIDAELNIVQALLDDLAHHVECRVVKVSSDEVKKSVVLIHHELKEIQKELEYHKTRYFNSLRTPNYDINLTNLCNHRDILRKGRELLISVVGIQRDLHRRNRVNNKSPTVVQPTVVQPTVVPPVIHAPRPQTTKKTFLERWLD